MEIPTFDFNTLGDFQKSLEKMEASRSIMPGIPVIARLDGKSFHTFTRGLTRPFDERLQTCMRETMEYLVDVTNANFGYTQSDEITLVWQNNDRDADFQYSGKFQKLASLYASHASVKFITSVQAHIPEKKHLLPVFDARVWQVPSVREVIENIVWRQLDASRNSITMAAQAYYSHKQLHGVGTRKKLQMLSDKGIVWNEYNPHFKRGIFAKRFKYEHTLTTAELSTIPEIHRPTGPVVRSKVMSFELTTSPAMLHSRVLLDMQDNHVDKLDPAVQLLNTGK